MTIMKRKTMQYKRSILFGITVIIFTVLVMMVDVNNAVRVFAKANIWLLIYAGLISLLFPVLCAIRWQILCSLLNTPLTFYESFQMIMAAWPLGALTPAKSGDLIKVVFLQDRLPYSTTTGIVFAERIIDVLVLGLFALLFGIWLKIYAAVITGIVILSGVIVFFFIVFSGFDKLIPNAFREKAKNIGLASRILFSHPTAMCWIILVTALNWFLSCYQTWICYAALNTAVPLFYIIGALPVTIFAGLLPITPAGMGTRDSAVMVLFHEFAPAEINLSIGIIYSIYGYWLLSILGIPFMRSALKGAFEHISEAELVKKIYNSSLNK